jgi:hypothetical protein
MSCGTQHKEAACPKCGSKMKRVGSWYAGTITTSSWVLENIWSSNLKQL